MKSPEGVSSLPAARRPKKSSSRRVHVARPEAICSFWPISFINWPVYLKMKSLTSMYTSLLGLNVLLTIWSETLMCGTECSRLMIKDFSNCMVTGVLHFFFPYFLIFFLPFIAFRYADTRGREEKKHFCCFDEGGGGEREKNAFTIRLLENSFA